MFERAPRAVAPDVVAGTDAVEVVEAALAADEVAEETEEEEEELSPRETVVGRLASAGIESEFIEIGDWPEETAGTCRFGLWREVAV